MGLSGMTKRQRVCIWLGIIAFSLTGLFPPWVESLNVPRRAHYEKSVGYSFLGTPPAPSSLLSTDWSHLAPLASIGVDYPRLLIEWAIVGAVTAVMLVTLGWKDRREPPWAKV